MMRFKWTCVAHPDDVLPPGDGRVRVVQLIATDIDRRGDGTPENPTRAVTQLWTLDGKLVAQHDPCDEPSTGGCNKNGHRIMPGAIRCFHCDALFREPAP